MKIDLNWLINIDNPALFKCYVFKSHDEKEVSTDVFFCIVMYIQ